MKATLITGASGGIGEAIAKKLAARKQNLVLVARTKSKLVVLSEQLMTQHSISVEYIVADLAEADAAQRIFDETQRRKLSIEMLINNAGVGSGGAFVELTLQAELALLQLNISSLVALTYLFLQEMIKQKTGTIVNVASMASFIPLPYMTTYSASKAFVRFFTQALSEECKPYNIHVMLLCPGLTKTNFNNAAGIDSEIGKRLGAEYNSSTQTPQQVADELLDALDREKHYIVSGRFNRLAARVSALLPNPFLAKSFARSYQKKALNLDQQNKRSEF